MSDDKTYNGWKNYETWAANLWIDGLTVDDLISDPEEYEDDQELTYAVAKALESYVDELDPLADECSMFSDLLHAAMHEIDYYEIAEHYVSDYRYDNPIKTSDNYRIEYSYNSPYMWESLTDNGAYSYHIDSFWEAFEECIQDAIDNNYTSVTIEWRLDPDELSEDSELNLMISRLMYKQNTRSEKVNKGE